MQSRTHRSPPLPSFLWKYCYWLKKKVYFYQKEDSFRKHDKPVFKRQTFLYFCFFLKVTFWRRLLLNVSYNEYPLISSWYGQIMDDKRLYKTNMARQINFSPISGQNNEKSQCSNPPPKKKKKKKKMLRGEKKSGKQRLCTVFTTIKINQMYFILMKKMPIQYQSN